MRCAHLGLGLSNEILTRLERGIGGQLVRHVVKEADERGYETLYLFTTDTRHFYEGLGWSFLEKTEYRGENVEIMKIDII